MSDDLAGPLIDSVTRARKDGARKAPRPDPRDPFGMACSSVTAFNDAHRHGRVVSWYRGDPAQGAWVLWDTNVTHMPTWEPRHSIVTGTGPEPTS